MHKKMWKDINKIIEDGLLEITEICNPFKNITEEENLDDYEHLSKKRQAVENTINSIVDVID